MRFAFLLSACDCVFPSGRMRVCVYTCVRYSFFFLSLLLSLFLSLARAPPLNLEYDRPVVHTIGTNSLAIKLLDGCSRAGRKSARENVDDRSYRRILLGRRLFASVKIALAYKPIIIFGKSDLVSVHFGPAIAIEFIVAIDKSDCDSRFCR